MNESRRWIWVLLGALLLVALAAAAVWALNAVRPPTRFAIASGSKEGTYYSMTTRFSNNLLKRGFQASVLETAGSAENLHLLKTGKADFALVQGGVAGITDTAGLSTVAMVSYEPVWLLINRSSFDKDVSELGPPDLAGKRIGIGAPGSGIQPVARDILHQVGISETNATLVELGIAAMAEGLRNDTLDVAFFVTTASNPTVQGLVRDPEIVLYEPIFRDAMTRKLPYLFPVTLNRGSFDMGQVIPEQDIPLLAVKTALVARQGIHPDLVRLALLTIPETVPRVSLIGERGEFPTLEGAEIEPNPDALEYFRSGTTAFERYLPFEIASPLSRFYLLLLPLAVLAVPAWSLIVNGYKWYMNSRVLNWYPEITAIDRDLDKYSLEQVDEKVKFLDELDAEITGRTKVSKGYLPAYFHLRSHMSYVKGRLEQRRAALLGKAAPAAPAAPTLL